MTLAIMLNNIISKYFNQSLLSRGYMSQKSVKIYITDTQRRILLVYSIIAIILTVVAFILWGTVKGIKPSPTSETFTLANENDYDSITIDVPDQYLVDISVITNDYVDVALFTLEDFNDKHSGGVYSRIVHIWTDSEDTKTSDNLDAGTYVIEAQSDSSTSITVEVSYTIYSDKSAHQQVWLMVGIIAPFSALFLALFFGFVTAIRNR